jgi:small subunit ribosomal protein S16
LARGGTHKRPYYSVVIADKASARDGKFIERIGHYDPLAKDNKSKIDTDKAQAWMKKGARPTDRVVKLLKVHGIEVPREMMDNQAHSPGKLKALEKTAAERKVKQEAKAKQAAAQAAAKEAAKGAEGGEAKAE